MAVVRDKVVGDWVVHDQAHDLGTHVRHLDRLLEQAPLSLSEPHSRVLGFLSLFLGHFGFRVGVL